MKTYRNFTNIILDSISLLLVLLFVYAAVNKILDFENFQVQLGQSPVLSAYAGTISWAVIIIELLISIFLSVKKFRIIGLYSAFTLMVMFTVYIYLILNYSSSIPCSCGGILEKLNWKQHLLFNICFVIISAIGVFLYSYSRFEKSYKYKLFSNKKYRYFSLSICFLFAVIIMVGLFIKSDNIMHFDNSFIRRFVRGTEKIHDINLSYNSFYFAGKSSDQIYLGNTTAPLLVTQLDTAFNKISKRKIKVDNELLSTGLQLRISNSSFYIIDGNVPSIFKGSLANWKATLIWKGKLRFTQPQLIDSLNISFRTIDVKTRQSELGSLHIVSGSRVVIHDNLLSKQVDGIFDVDGKLYYDPEGKRHVYIYLYRNEFVVADQNLKLEYTHHTIDTTSLSKVKVVYLKNRGEKKLSAPPIVVNNTAALTKNLLFINSGITGRFEDKKMWDQASIIDVYDLNKKSYLSSFYIYHINKEKLRSFYVNDKYLYALVGDNLVAYRISGLITRNYN